MGVYLIFCKVCTNVFIVFIFCVLECFQSFYSVHRFQKWTVKKIYFLQNMHPCKSWKQTNANDTSPAPLPCPCSIHAWEQEQWIVGVLPRYYDTQASESCHVHVIQQPADYQLLFLCTNSPDAAANAKYNLEILNVPSYVYINSFVILVYVSQSSTLSSYLHSFNSCDTEMWILSSTSIIW